MKKTILFVDDEPNIIQGLKRMLRSTSNKWEMLFAEGGEEALELLKIHQVDVIVTDMRMPGMDGAELLNIIMRDYPHMIRIILSGHCDQETILRATASAHQFLVKPCDTEVLKNTIENTLNMRNTSITNITEQKRIEDELIKYKLLYDNARDIILFIKPDGQIIDANCAAVLAYGYDREELVTMNMKNLQEIGTEFTLTSQLDQALTNGHLLETVHYRKDGSLFMVEVSSKVTTFNSQPVLVSVIRDITERNWAEQALREAHSQIKQLVSSLSAILIGVSGNGIINQWNSAAEKCFGISVHDAISIPFEECDIKWDWNLVKHSLANCKKSNEPIHLDNFGYTSSKGSHGLLSLNINPVSGDDGSNLGFVILGNDVTEKKSVESQVALSQKLESIGQLASGIAHEINTPMQYIGDNVRFLKEAFFTVQNMLDNQFVQEITNNEQESELEFLREDIPKAIDQSLEGIERVRKIILALKDFSHPGKTEKSYYNLNNGIENTVILSKNEWKYVAELETILDPDLPLVFCAIDQINQVFLNMIINSAQSIKEKTEKKNGSKGKITIETRKIDDRAQITISDTGKGIPQSIIHKIYDPFFTTKDVGQGTGQGLAIAHDIIVNKHNGIISASSVENVGVKFEIYLPIN